MRIRGTVLDTSGAPTRAEINVVTSDDKWIARETTTLQEPLGRFDFVVRGVAPFRVTARAWGWPELGDSEPVVVVEETEALTLRLTRPARIFGNVVDATGQPCSADIVFASGNGSGTTHSHRDGQFDLAFRDGGTLSVAARRSDGRWTIEPDIHVAAHGDVGPIRLELRPMAKLNVHYHTSSQSYDVRVTCGAFEIAQGPYSPLYGFTCDVPAQYLTVTLNDIHSDWKSTRTVTPRSGEQAELVFD